ncbi:DNA-packaging protein gp3 [Chryseobacterium sp. 52]|uniref:terminase small subunit n=1 Tax=Chryseobacterium sp. 52 TaxID=2035213 RepID=UPI000C19EC2D|nr:terminase small subunit [Chryseobacterium sp. 52]PIF44313.1 DNA-packaging protein gp3 [Chryseobacterium sp. 52]
MAKDMKDIEGRDPDGKFAKGNSIALGNSGGAPPIYSDPVEVKEKIDEYFEYIKGEFIMKPGERYSKTKNLDGTVTEVTETYEYEEWIRNPERPSVTGLAIFLGFESRQSMYDYEKKSVFSYIIKRGLLLIEDKYVGGLWLERPTGVIFALKNMGWSDKTEIEQTSKNINYDIGGLSDEEKQSLFELSLKIKDED